MLVEYGKPLSAKEITEIVYTDQGFEVPVDATPAERVQNGTVVKTVITASNGVIHVIDTVTLRWHFKFASNHSCEEVAPLRDQ